MKQAPLSIGKAAGILPAVATKLFSRVLSAKPRRMMRLCLALPACLLLTAACGNFDSLSSVAGISSFSIDSVYNETVSLGTPAVDDAHSTVSVPLNYGKYVPNITFRARVSLQDGAGRLLNLNTDSVCFRSWEEEVIFYVAAKSGLVREWNIRLVPVAADSTADVLAVSVGSVEPAGSVVVDSALVMTDGQDHIIKFIAPLISFPATIVPHYELTPGATVKGGEKPLTFESRTDIKTVEVEAADGFVQPWSVMIEPAEAVYADNQDNYTASQLYAVNIAEDALRITVENAEGREPLALGVDSVNNDITALINPDTSFPLTLNVRTHLRRGQLIAGLPADEPVVINSVDDKHGFYLIDRYQNIKKLWKIRLETYKNSDADVTSFRLTRCIPSSISFDTTMTEIDPVGGTVTLFVSDGAWNFPAQLRADIGVSQNARLEGLESGGDFMLQDLRSTRSFKVIAENGTEKPWSIRLAQAGQMNTEADVEAFQVVSYQGAQGLLRLNADGIVDKAGKTVTLTLTRKGSDMPLQIKARVSASYKATMIEGAFTADDVLTFNSTDDTYRFTLRSEDGLTTNTYTIRLDDQSPVGNSEASLISFRTTNVASGYTLADTRVDQDNRHITLTVTKRGSGSFSFIPVIILADGATSQGIENGTAFSFGQLSEVKTFTITSEDLTNTATWTISINYEPALVNGTLDSWTDGNPTGWCSSNNPFTTLVSQGTGRDGSVCAKLSPKKVLGNFAAGSFFLGTFKMDLTKLGDPKAMTNFGVSFDGRPKSLSAEVNYTAGTDDRGSIDIHLLNYTGSDPMEYHTYGSKNSSGQYVADPTKEPGVTVVGYGRLIVDDTNGWTTLTLPVDYYYAADQLPVTHIYVSFSTSHEGDLLKGSTGSLMLVDNVVLNY